MAHVASAIDDPEMPVVIEGETGRKVVAFMSGSHQDPDLLAEVFVLEASDLTD